VVERLCRWRAAEIGHQLLVVEIRLRDRREITILDELTISVSFWHIWLMFFAVCA